MQISWTAFFLVSVLVSLGPCRPAAAQADEGASASLVQIATQRGVEQQAAAAAWLERYGAKLTDDEEYLRLIALHWAEHQVAAPGDEILTLAAAEDWKPAAGLESAVVDLLYARFELAVNQKEAELTQRIVPVALRIAPKTSDAYRELGGALRASDLPVFRSQFTKLMGRLLGDERVSSKQRYALSVEIMRSKPRPTRLALFVKMPKEKGDDGKPIPNRALDGGEVSLEQYRGKVLLIDFWATWCGPCLRAMPDIVAAHEKYHDKGFDVLGISLDSEKTRDRIPRTMKQLGMKWRQICDGGGWKSRFAVANEINAIPFTFLLDKQGTIRYAGVHIEDLMKKIEQLLAE